MSIASRRVFASLPALSALSALLAACGGDVSSTTAPAAPTPYAFDVTDADGHTHALQVRAVEALPGGAGVRYSVRLDDRPLTLVVVDADEASYREVRDADERLLGAVEIDAEGWLRAEAGDGGLAANFPARLDAAEVANLLPEGARLLVDDAVVARVEAGPAPAGVEVSVSALRISVSTGSTQRCCTFPNGAGTCCCTDAAASCYVVDGSPVCWCGAATTVGTGGGVKML